MDKANKKNYMKMFNMLLSYVQPCLIASAAKYIVDHLLLKPMNAHELAITNTNEDNLRRLLQSLEYIGILEMGENNNYCVTEFGETLKSDDKYSLKYFAQMLLEECYFAIGCLSLTIETGEPSFDYIYGKTFYQFLKQNPNNENTFYKAMLDLNNTSFRSTAAKIDFSVFRRIIDVGGGNGTFMRYILSHNKNVKGIVFDRQSVIEKADITLKTEFRARCKLIAGDFLKSVPGGGDCYIIKQVIFNSSDETTLKLLKNIRKRSKPNTKIFIIEPMSGREISVMLDAITMASMGGKIRDTDEYKNLLTAGGLIFVQKIELPECYVDIIEATL